MVTLTTSLDICAGGTELVGVGELVEAAEVYVVEEVEVYEDEEDEGTGDEITLVKGNGVDV